jgi:hypothetical protein
MLEDPKYPKNNKAKYVCNLCYYNTCNKKDFNRHILSLKHTKEMMEDPKNPKDYKCNCGKIYKYNQGLWKHRKKCDFIEKE